MISINGTLLVQIVSFLWAWWFLNRFLLKPIVAVALQEDVTQQTVQKSIEHYEHQVAVKKRYKQDRWFDFQLLFVRGAPTLTGSPTGVCNLPHQPTDVSALTPQEKKDLQHTTAQLIATRISDGY